MFNFDKSVFPKYFYHNFSLKFYNRVMMMTAKTSVDSVRYEMIAKMNILIPNKQEQIKISKTLDNIDNLITLHQRKQKSAKTHKKQQKYVDFY